MKKAVFRGTITTVTPLLVMLPGLDVDDHPTLQVIVNDRHYNIPVIPGNTLRYQLRKEIVHDMLCKFTGLDYIDIVFITNGGIIDPKQQNKSKKSTDTESSTELDQDEQEQKNQENKDKLSIDEKYQVLNNLKERHLIADLFGGALPYGIGMIHGKLVTEYAWLEDYERFIQDDGFDPFDSFYISSHGFVRRNSVIESYEYYSKLSKQGLEELHKRMAAKAKRKAKESETGKKEKRESSETGEHIDQIPRAIAPGVKFTHIIEIKEPKPRDVGAILSALKNFAFKAQIGGYKRFGWGKLQFKYGFYLIEGKNTNALEGPPIGFIEGGYKGVISDDEKLTDSFLRISDPYNQLEHYINAYRDYINNLTKEDITIASYLPNLKKAKGVNNEI